VIYLYNYKNYFVLSVFLDASEAFHNVLHSKLAQKLIDNGMRIYYVRLLYFWWKE